MTEHRELAVDLMINAHNLFLYFGGNVVAADETRSAGCFRENAAVRAAGVQKRICILVNEAGRNRIVRERASGYERRQNGR